jgi:hypothetical protein
MRQSKLQFYLDFLPNIVHNMIVLRYEDLLTNPENIVSFISTNYNVKKTNTPYNKRILPRKKSSYNVRPDILDIINNNTDWVTECRFNYFPKLK